MSSSNKQALLQQLLAAKGVRPMAAGEAAPGPRPAGEPAGLSFAQERLWFVQQLQSGNTAYHQAQAFALRGAVDVPALQAAFAGLLARHEALRCAFPEKDGRGACAIAPAGGSPLGYEDLSALAPAERATAVRARERTVFDAPFDLARPPLLRALLLKLGRDDFRLLFCVHHLVFDGWSIGVVTRELGALYGARVQGQAAPLAPLPLQYADYAAWQRRRAASPAWGESLKFWERKLANTPILVLPTDFRRPAAPTGRGAGHRFEIPASLVAGLRALGQKEQATLFSTLLAAWQVLLGRYTGQADFAIGSPVANRGHAALEGLAGFFVNMIALRADLAGDPPFRALLRRVAAATQEALAHQEIPFEQIVERLKVTRDLAHHAVFQVGFTLQNTPVEPVRLAGVEFAPIDPEITAAKFDLLLSAEDAPGGGLRALIEYSTDLFEASSVRLLAENFLTLLAGIVAAPDTALAKLPILSAAECELWPSQPHPRPEAPGRGQLMEWFARTSAQYPERVAVNDGRSALTYAELDARSDALANFLTARGAAPERLVSIAMERGVLQMVAMLGVMKAGAAYLPIDPAYPRDRQTYMLQDGNALLVLTDRAMRDRVAAPPGMRVVSLEDDWAEIAAAPAAPRPEISPDNIAYVIYTSGSTGRPKGVPMAHRGVCRLLTQTEHWYKFAETDVWTMFHSFAFDFSVWEIWGAFLYGGRLMIVPYEVSRAADKFHELLRREGVTILSQTPSAFRQLVSYDASLPDVKPFALRWVVFGGEALDFQTLKPWFLRHGDRQPRMVNMYGITETCVHTTYREVTMADVESHSASVIGEPIPDLTVYLLDPHLQVVPRGVAGEIFVGGPGLARCYHNRPELTAERFIAHPLAPDGRLYRSGDSARRLANNDVEYLGRIDFQVKVRGFRIELGEIQSALSRHAAIAAAAVLALREPNGDSRLAAWLVQRGDREPSAEELRKHLLGFLPDYMVPAAFTFVEKLPLTTNGKVDRAALPALAGRRAEAAVEHVEPETDRERLLAAVWARVLGVPRVGATANFFALGGDSIRSIEVRAGVRAQGWDFQLQDLFRHQTVRELAAALAPVATAAAPAAGAFALLAPEDRAKLPAGAVDAYPLSALQAGMVFHSDLHPESAVFHDLFSFHLKMTWDEKVLREVLATVMARHPILRTSFDPRGFREPLQLVHAQLPVPLVLEDVSALVDGAQDAAVDAWFAAEKKRHFTWTRPPLWRVTVHRRTPATVQFTLTVHHAILDGWSVSALLAEIFTRYLDAVGGRPAPAGEAPPLFRDYVALERAALASDETRKFWAAQLDDPPALRLPRAAGHRAPEVPVQDAVFVTYPPAQVAALAALAAREGVSLKHVLLAAHAKAVSHLGAQRDVLTGVVSNGRPETERAAESLGLFLNTAPYRIDVAPGTWRDLVRAAFRADEAVLPHRRYPLAELQKAHGRSALFETSFNYVHFHVFDALRARGDFALLGARHFDQNTFTLFAQFTASPGAGELQLELRYDVGEFTRAQAEDFAAVYGRVLAAIAAESAARHEACDLLAPAERRRVVEEFNAPVLPAGAPRLLHDSFFASAARTPQAVALVDGARRLTYAELAARVRTWAARLRAAGTGPETLVGVCLERGADLVTALLAVLEAGAAYVPLDPAYPADRLAFMCEDARVRVLVSRRELAARLPSGGWQLLTPEDCAAGAASAPAVATVQPESLAYLIYTSGSTGRPKATAIEHRNATALLAWARASFSPAELAGVLFSTSVCFDLSIYELFVTLAAGGKVIVADNALALPTLPARDEVTLINTVPSAAAELVRQRAIPAGVRVVNLAGEPLSATLAEQIYATGTVGKVHDLYGPSEDTTYSTWALRARGGPETIGRVLPGSQLYLLDDNFQPVPLGAVGEIFLGGAGLARGYLGRPDLTAERFVPNPFAREPGARLYRTGDVARFMADGQLQFLGRRDQQVKIRGFRIELGEIKAVLEQHAAVAEAAVLARDTAAGQKQLIAYVAGPGLPAGRALDAELRAWLGARLPEYFVPSVFVPLPRLPLTPNGKLDRAALPAPAEGGAAAAADDFVAPRDAAETTLAAIWRDVLKVPRVGAHDNYFALGGDSILVLQIVARAREAGFALTPRLVFERPTVAEIAAAAGRVEAGAARAGNQADEARLLPIQRWFFAQEFAEPQHWNQSILLTARQPLDPAAMEQALAAVVGHHPALTQRFVRDAAGAWQAVPGAENKFGFRTVKLSDSAEITAVCAAEQAALDLERGPTVRAVWFDGGAQPGRLFIVIHHLVVDGVSWRVLLDDLLAAYQARRAGQAPRLQPATVTPGAWSAWLTQLASGFELAAEEAHWRGLAAAGRQPFPRDFADDSNRVADSVRLAVSLTPAETETLLRRALGAYGAQINDVLLAALGLTLREWTGRAATTIHVEGHGRETGDTGLDLSRSVGWFTSLFPVRLDVGETSEPGDVVARVRTQLAATPRRGLSYGVGRWLAQPPRWEVPAAELCFNYLGQVDGVLGADSPFAPATEDAGPHCSPRGRRAHLLDVNGIVVGGALRFEWHYATRRHRAETIARLAERHLAHLRALLAAAETGSVRRFDLAGGTDDEVSRAIEEIQF